MQEKYTAQSTLVITGMPRSGTSFTASVLQSAGLHIGQRLMAPGHGNERGFFEDLDIVHFQEAVLRAQGEHHVGWTLADTIEVAEHFVAEAKAIIAKNAGLSVWGWKDPRTTLFLDFWAELLPQANFFFVYRAPWEVVDSIYRRGDELFDEDPALAIKVWMHYNQKLLHFYDAFPERCLLASVYTITDHAPVVIEAINAKFGFNLVAPDADLFEQSLLHRKVSSSYRPALINHCFPEAIEMYRELTAREIPTGTTPDLTWQEKIEAFPDTNWAFQDWLRIRRLEKKVKNLRDELAQTQLQLQQTQISWDDLLTDAGTESSDANATDRT